MRGLFACLTGRFSRRASRQAARKPRNPWIGRYQDRPSPSQADSRSLSRDRKTLLISPIPPTPPYLGSPSNGRIDQRPEAPGNETFPGRQRTFAAMIDFVQYAIFSLQMSASGKKRLISRTDSKFV